MKKLFLGALLSLMPSLVSAACIPTTGTDITLQKIRLGDPGVTWIGCVNTSLDALSNLSSTIRFKGPIPWCDVSASCAPATSTTTLNDLTSCINTVLANCPEGNEVRFSSGVYYTASTVVLPAKQLIYHGTGQSDVNLSGSIWQLGGNPGIQFSSAVTGNNNNPRIEDMLLWGVDQGTGVLVNCTNGGLDMDHVAMYKFITPLDIQGSIEAQIKDSVFIADTGLHGNGCLLDGISSSNGINGNKFDHDFCATSSGGSYGLLTNDSNPSGNARINNNDFITCDFQGSINDVKHTGSIDTFYDPFSETVGGLVDTTDSTGTVITAGVYQNASNSPTFGAKAAWVSWKPSFPTLAIGTSAVAAAAFLDVETAVNNHAGFFNQSTGAQLKFGTDRFAGYQNGFIDAGTIILQSFSGGNTAIGGSAAAYTLQVNGAEQVTGQQITGSTMTVKGNAFSVGGSTFAVSGGVITNMYVGATGSTSNVAGAQNTWTPSTTGCSDALNVGYARYTILGKWLLFSFHVSCTSNSTAWAVWGPFPFQGSNDIGICDVEDNGVLLATEGSITPDGAGSAKIDIEKAGDFGTTGWTASGTKAAYCTGMFELQ